MSSTTSPSLAGAPARVFIANFGRENYLWATCLARSTVATFESLDLRPFTLAGDRAGFIAHCIATKKTAAGITPTAPVASRWFNLAEIISSTEDDLWIHREKSELWWTLSRVGDVEVSEQPSFDRTEKVYELHKPAQAWSNKTRKGARLLWDALHAKARAFLFTEGTLQQLAADNASYALALIEGDDVRAWHARPDWKAKEELVKRSAVTIFDAKRRSIIHMAKTALETAAASRGQQVLRTLKVKECRFPHQQALEKYITDLLDAQERLCAITGIPLQFEGEHEDAELLCSLDRIDSDGHYEAGNLQVVCRFVNRWKNDGNNDAFRRLIDLVRRTSESG